MILSFPKASQYLKGINLETAEKLDIIASELLSDENAYERASQALRRRFSRGAETVEAIDRGGRKTSIKRVLEGKKYRYFVQATNGDWVEPEERIWVVAMYALWQASKRK